MSVGGLAHRSVALSSHQRGPSLKAYQGDESSDIDYWDHGEQEGDDVSECAVHLILTRNDDLVRGYRLSQDRASNHHGNNDANEGEDAG